MEPRRLQEGVSGVSLWFGLNRVSADIWSKGFVQASRVLDSHLCWKGRASGLASWAFNIATTSNTVIYENNYNLWNLRCCYCSVGAATRLEKTFSQLSK